MEFWGWLCGKGSGGTSVTITPELMSASYTQDYSTYNDQYKIGDSGIALGKYDLLYSSHKDRIKSSLDQLGIKYDSNNDADIQQKFLNSPKAQDIAGASAQGDFEKGTNRLLTKYSNLNLNPNKVFYLTRYLGSGGADKYIELLSTKGVDYADQYFQDEWDRKGVKNTKVSLGLNNFMNRFNNQ